MHFFHKLRLLPSVRAETFQLHLLHLMSFSHGDICTLQYLKTEEACYTLGNFLSSMKNDGLRESTADNK
jgi:hypothetical protein